MWEGLCEFRLNALQKGGRDLHDIIFNVGKKLPVVIAKEVEDGFCSAPRPCSCFDYSDFITLFVLLV